MSMLEAKRSAVLPAAKLYIDGVVRMATGGRTYDNMGPWIGAPVGVAADATAEDVDHAIAAARRAFDTTDWSTNHAKRFALVKKFYELFLANRDRLSDIARHEAGAGLFAVNMAQVATALDGWKALLDLFPKIEWEKDHGTTQMYGATHHRKVVQEAIGVVAAITPWNFPFGGYKYSGIGRAWGIEGIEEYMEVKTVAWPA